MPPTGAGLTRRRQGAHALQQIKGRVHRRLIERLNLSNLDKLDRQQVVEAIRKVVHDLLTQESVPLNFEERDAGHGRCSTRSSAWARWSR